MANRINYPGQFSAGVRFIKPDDAEKHVPIGGRAGQILAKKSASELDVEWIDPVVIPEAPAEEESFEMFVAGELVIGTDKYGFTAPFDMTIKEIQVAVATAPTGASAIFDINNNGTTIYTTQENRPTLIAEAASVTAVLPDEVEVVKGDLITLDIDQVGSTETGETLMVTILCEVTREPA